MTRADARTHENPAPLTLLGETATACGPQGCAVPGAGGNEAATAGGDDG